MFSQGLQYSLRLAAFVALHQEGKALTGHDIASGTGVPPAYAHKLLRKLVAGRVLKGSRGRGGGFALAKAASEITLAEVMSCSSENVFLTGCVFGLKHCGDSSPCALHSVWAKLRAEVSRWAQTTTLQEVVEAARLKKGKDPLGEILDKLPKRALKIVAQKGRGTRRAS
jgi:Rrf2 family iron-sulfur cluster assembly transcriptional regulator